MEKVSAFFMLKCFQDLYNKGEGSDFTIVCGDVELPVHSFILSTRSPVLDRSVNGDFRESREKKLRIEGFKSSSVTEMVRFLYGFEVSEELEDPEELLALADMYLVEGLKEAALTRIMDNINTENVFKIVRMVENNSKEFIDCVKFVEENFELKKLLEDGILDEDPRLGLELFKRRPPQKFHSVVRIFGEVGTSQMIEYTDRFVDFLMFTTDTDIMLTGIGLFVHHSSPDLTAYLTLCINKDEIDEEGHILTENGLRNILLRNDKHGTNVQRVNISPILLTAGKKNQLFVRIEGTGCSDGGFKRHKKIMVDGLNKEGKFVTKVKFKFSKFRCNDLIGQIPEIYFTVNE